MDSCPTPGKTSGLPRELVGQVRRLDEPQLRRLLILARGLLLTSEEPAVAIDDVPGMPGVSYHQRVVRCGKAACSACPHGPYWYARWREDGRTRTMYIGSELPADVRRRLEAADDPPAATANGAVPRLRVV